MQLHAKREFPEHENTDIAVTTIIQNSSETFSCLEGIFIKSFLASGVPEQL
jgi:hypothetical protein